MTNLPVSGVFEITAAFGEVNKKLWATFHKGIDFSGGYGQTVYNVCNGIVESTGYDKRGWGNYVVVKDNERTGIKYFFCHLSKVNVNNGKSLNRNSVIGIMGTTGNSTGVHLHFEMQVNGVPTDPSGYLLIPNKRGVYNSKDYQVKAVAQAPQPIYMTVSTKLLPLWLNERVGGGKGLALMPKGSKVELIEKTNPQWYKVKYKGIIGYASTQYLK